MSINIQDLLIHENKLYLKSDNEWVRGWNTIEINSAPPACHFKGGKMSLHLWYQILAFFKWTQDKYKSESQVRLYYNKESKSWAAHPYPQSPSGMTTNDRQDEEIRAKFPEPWVYFGTAHHHCTTKAFQSGTDEANEKEQDGWHYTIGHLDQEIYDYHGRFSWGGELFPADLFSWLEMPDWAKGVPHEVRYYSAYDYVLHSNISAKEEFYFPEEWKDSIKPVQTYTRTNSGFGYNQTYLGGGYGYNSGVHEPKEREVKIESVIHQEVEDILFDAGCSDNEAMAALMLRENGSEVENTAPSEIVELEFILQNIELTLKDRGIDIETFKRKLTIYSEEEDITTSII